MLPEVGQFVSYRLSANDVESILLRRQFYNQVGERVRPGDVVPMLVTRVLARWHQDGMGALNGRLMLDGDDTHWVRYVRESSTTQGCWFHTLHGA